MIERELRRALGRGELRLEFQPVVRASTGRIVGAEALLRWQHPTRGLLAPGDFLGDAARCGLLADIGEWVLAEAIAERATWPSGTFVSVNVSPSELAVAHERGLVDHIARACERSGVAPSDVWIEVTEQPIVDRGPTAAVLGALGHLGVTVVLDDFGSGYASLTRLRHLPFEVCKLDRSFVAGLAGDGGARVVRAAIALARTLGTDVVAEGVETADQREQLEELGCDLLQGYHLFRPAPASDLRERFASMAAVPALEPRVPVAEVAGNAVHDARELRSALLATSLGVRAQARLEGELRELQRGLDARDGDGGRVRCG